MKKTIHIYTQYYFPISNACSNRVEKYVIALKDNYDLKIITWMPNYPTWVKSKEYKWKIFKKETWNLWEKIIRTYEFATSNDWSLSRITNYLSFMISSFLYWLFTKKPDIIIVTSPPLFTAIGILLLHKIRNIPYILEIRDLWPDSIVALWYMEENNISFKLFSYIEKKLYKNAKQIIWVTKWICKSIESKWFSKYKITLQYNIAEVVDWIWLGNPYNQYADLIKWRKIVLFAGNMNEAYDFIIVYKYIKDNKNLFFIFIWDWGEKPWLKNNLQWLDNFLFLDRKPKKEINKFIYYSNKIIIPLKNEEFYNWTFPVKGIEWIVNRKEIIFFWPKNGEFNKYLLDLKSWKINFDYFKFDYFKNNINWLIK